MQSLAELELHAHCAHGTVPHLLDSHGATIPSGNQLLLIDDTMHLRSMRLACYRIAAEEGASFVCLHVSAPLEVLLDRNAKRRGAARVPEASLRKIYAEIEPPCADKEYWERDSLFLQHPGGTADHTTSGDCGQAHNQPSSADGHSENTLWHIRSCSAFNGPTVAGGDNVVEVAEASLDEIWAALLQLWARQPSPMAVEAARADASAAVVAQTRTSQAETSASLVHAVDASLREAVAGSVQQAKQLATSGNSGCTAVSAVKQTAAAANRARKAVLHEAKTGLVASAAWPESPPPPLPINKRQLQKWAKARFLIRLSEFLISV